MDILKKVPELKSILGHTGKEDEFRQVLKNMKPEDLVSLSHYLSHKIENSDRDIWEKERDVRKVQSQINVLQSDYQRIRANLYKIQTTLRDSFVKIYKKPENAEKACIQTEKKKGLVKTGWVLRAKPSSFGTLKGFSIFGMKSNSRKKAKEIASDLDYEHMRKDFNEGKKMATWLSHILKGA